MDQNTTGQTRRQNQTKTKSKKGSGWGIFILLFGYALLRNGEGLSHLYRRARFALLRHDIRIDPIFLLVLGIAVVVALLFLAAKTAARRAETGEGNRSAGRTSAAVQRRDPRSKSFTQPDPYCVVCDHTGEDHFQRDKAQRIRQLDEWLKSGLIDRSEYRVLRDRYERDL